MRVGNKGIILIAVVLLVVTAGAAAAQDTVRGGELFVTYCAMCHGLDGRGRVGADLNEFPGIDAEAAIGQVILEGISGSSMPAFGRSRRFFRARFSHLGSAETGTRLLPA